MKLNIGKILLLAGLLGSGFPLAARAEKAPLVVQIVVGSMRPEDLDRYAPNFCEGGFRRLTEGGTLFTRAAYDYQQTVTPTALATITSGCMPSTHGIVASHWRDYVENKRVSLIDDPSVSGLEYHTGGGQYSPRQLIAPTVSETLKQYSPDSKILTIALEPESAVVLGGKAGLVFWMNDELCHWRSSSYYMSYLPEWVKQYNRERAPLNFVMQPWSALKQTVEYRNRRRSDIYLLQPERRRGERAETGAPIREITSEVTYRRDYDRLAYTPAGNSAVFSFAKLALSLYGLGKGDAPDLLNICLDTPRRITEAYGPESIEAEDMYYRLDRDLEDFLTFLFAQAKDREITVILTSDHGTSPSWDLMADERDRFNVPQFEMILESFLDARYGKQSQNWLLEYENKMIYLNHNLIYEKRLSLADVQNEVATFAMQFRGVSHALSATAMRTSYFGSGYAEKMQNSFYPRRSGDVILNLMPGWIEKRDAVRSSSGSMYGYDTRVPLIVYRSGQTPRRVDRPVEMRAVAPTVARLLGIPEPAASEAEALREATEQ